MVLGGLILFLCFFLFITCCFFRVRRYWKLQFLNKIDIDENGAIVDENGAIIDDPKTARDLLAKENIEDA